MWPFNRRKDTPKPSEPPRAHWSTHIKGKPGFGGVLLEEVKTALEKIRPKITGVAMDDNSTGMPNFKSPWSGFLPDALTGWFVSQSFIGYQVCAMIAQNWLVDKACTMPARDAIRHGFNIHVGGLAPGVAGEEDGRESELVEKIRELDKQFRLNWNMEQFVKMGRLFGVRVLLFRVKSGDPKYYENPFNPDGITPGSYLGLSQVDPYWCIPELDADAVTDPSSPHFYEPTWWVIGGKRYHRTHLCIFRNSEVPDVLKPMYNYGGISVPQRIVERVYAAERTANEGPQLAMTKRLTVWKTDLAAIYANQEKAAEHMAHFTQFRDNHGVKLVDTDDAMETHDTTLSDLDVTIMTQYQLVAAASHVPATKLLGTTPKGFNATGEYDESSYHEELETVQTNDLTPVLERHYTLLLRSHVEPAEAIAPGTLTVNIDWAPVDSPTAKEYAEINKLNAETDNALVTVGAIDGMDVRNRIKSDPNSGYTGIADPAADDEDVDGIINEVLGIDPPSEAAAAI